MEILIISAIIVIVLSLLTSSSDRHDYYHPRSHRPTIIMNENDSYEEFRWRYRREIRYRAVQNTILFISILLLVLFFSVGKSCNDLSAHETKAPSNAFNRR
jgi:hypothetical protein